MQRQESGLSLRRSRQLWLVLLLWLVGSAISAGTASSAKTSTHKQPPPLSKEPDAALELAADGQPLLVKQLTQSNQAPSSECELLSTIAGRENNETEGKTKVKPYQTGAKSDSMRILKLAGRMLQQLKKDLPHLWKLYLVIIMMIALGWKTMSAWIHGSISVPQSLILFVAILVAEVVTVRWIRDLDKIQISLLMAFPVAALVGVSVMAKIHDRESRNVVLNAEAQLFHEAIARDPQNVAAHEFLGDTYLKLKKLNLAISEYRSALALSPGDNNLSWKLRRAVRVKGNRFRLLRCP